VSEKPEPLYGKKEWREGKRPIAWIMADLYAGKPISKADRRRLEQESKKDYEGEPSKKRKHMIDRHASGPGELDGSFVRVEQGPKDKRSYKSPAVRGEAAKSRRSGR
jgi:hypothetical protein